MAAAAWKARREVEDFRQTRPVCQDRQATRAGSLINGLGDMQ